MLPEIMTYYDKTGTSFIILTQRKISELRRLPGVKHKILKLSIPLFELISEALDALFGEKKTGAALFPTNKLLYRALYALIIRLQPGKHESVFASTIDGRV